MGRLRGQRRTVSQRFLITCEQASHRVDYSTVFSACASNAKLIPQRRAFNVVTASGLLLKALLPLLLGLILRITKDVAVLAGDLVGWINRIHMCPRIHVVAGFCGRILQMGLCPRIRILRRFRCLRLLATPFARIPGFVPASRGCAGT